MRIFRSKLLKHSHDAHVETIGLQLLVIVWIHWIMSLPMRAATLTGRAPMQQRWWPLRLSHTQRCCALRRGG
jgi:hypothetical protein